MKVLIARTDRLGDTLLCLPMIELIRSQFSMAKVYFLVRKESRPMIEDYSLIEKIFEYSPSESKMANFFKLRQVFQEVRPDFYIFAGGDRLPSFVALWEKVRVRGGVLVKFIDYLLLNKGERQHRSYVEMHEAEYNLNLLKCLGINYKHEMRDQISYSLSLPEKFQNECREDFEKLAEESGLKGEYILVHPGMRGHTLNWTMRGYLNFMLTIERKMPGKYFFVISYTSVDAAYLEKMKQELENDSERFKAIAGKLLFFNGEDKGLRYFMSVLSGGSLCIGPSTGVLHLANCLGQKVVALYSPIRVQSAMRWGPFNRDPLKTAVLVPDVACGEIHRCAGKSCPYYECMASIEGAKVGDLALKLLV